MAANLVIVESPAKAKTIEGYLGKDFLVKSSFGHVRDLASKGLSVDVEKGFEPVYEVSDDKKKVVSELKKLAKDAEIVWLATDEDREGEAISWHLVEALGLKKEGTRRITFNEITKGAVLDAIENPRDIDVNLVNAQQARRVLDRLVGFELSPILWKKVKPSLSAGRVQSVTVRLIVEREREIQDFTPVSSYKVSALFKKSTGETVKATLADRIPSEEEVMAFLEKCKGATYTVQEVIKKPGKKSPAAPFTTSTLQQEASRKLGYSVGQTMSVAQKLYEAGKITYMRTDSVNLSDTALEGSKNAIIQLYGADYANPKKYANKNKGAQEAHEAIRPTDLSLQEAGSEGREQKLYDLIWKRTIASQMADAQLEKTTVKIKISTTDEILVAQGEVLKFEGFLKVYLEGKDEEGDEDNSSLLPPLTEGENMIMESIEGVQRFSHHPPRYTEASLVKKLEELGIGRPSTYAPTISTVQKRGYVEKESKEGYERQYNRFVLTDEIVKEELTERTGVEKNKLFPTDIGIVVNDFLVEHFDKILDYNFTATVEKEFDDIAEGQLEWNKMIEQFYGPFHEKVEVTLETSERAKGERELGTDPETGKPVIVRIGRFGPMVQIGSVDDEEKPKFASLLKDQSITTITFEEAMELFKLPRTVGDFEGEEVVAAIGRFGPYVRHKGKFTSLKKGIDDPYTIEIDRAIELIKEKREADANKFINEFEHDPPVQVLNGRYGPYIKIGKKNYRMPKGQEPKELTLEDCLRIAEEQDQKKGK